MHVCHVITRLIIGGAQENTLLTCEGLRARGHRVTLISGPTAGPEGSLVGRAKSGGAQVVELPELIRAVNPWMDLRARRELAALFRALRPDIVHTHSSKAGIIGRLAAADARVPRIVHTVHGMSFNRTQPALIRWLYAILERRAARVTHRTVSVADAMTRQMLGAGVGSPHRYQTIYSGMEIERFTPSAAARAAARSRWSVDAQHVVVGTVARLFRRKGYEQLIPIMAAAAEQTPSLRFVWVGDGAQRRAYESELERRGLRDRTHLVGLVAPEDMAAQIAGFDILAHASQWEGLPRTVVQALLMRVPAIAFDIDGTPEVVVDGVTGRLVPLNDEREFARAIKVLAADAALRARLGAAGREHCVERFDWRRMVDQIEALYDALSRRRPDPAGEPRR